MDAGGFEEALARLMSLLEGHITEEKAREALQASGGIVEMAMARLFDGTSGSLSGDQDRTACDSSTVIDIDMSDADDGGTTDDALSETPHKQRKPTPASDSCRSKRRRLIPMPSTPEADAEVLVSGSMAEGGSSGSRAWPSKPAAAEAPARPLPASVEAAFRALGPGWELLGESSQWATLGISSALFGQDWAQRIQAQDPPCLSLQGQKEFFNKASTSSGEMHSASGNSSGMTSLTEQVMQENVHWFEGANVAVKTSLLRELFKSVLPGVRYPPAELELSWRLVEAGPKNNRSFTPPDLCGPIPSKPFRLLDNSSDAAAEQPPHFQNHPLRPEQRRSLAWMLAREEGEAVGSDDAGSISKDQCVVEWRRFWSPESHGGKEVDQIVVGASVRFCEDAQGPFATAEDPHRKQNISQLHGAGELQSRTGPQCIVKFARGLETLRVICSPKELEFVDLGGIHPGCRVTLQPDLKSPAYGWGGINKQMVGVLLRHEGENVCVKWPTHCSWKGKAVEIKRADMGIAKDVRLATLDLRVRASYAVRGGILADKIGYGKTATTIALIDQGLNSPLPVIPVVDKGRFIPAKGTLVIVPSNLFEQWLNEIGKFIWNGPLRQSMKGGWSPKSFPMKILAMSNVSPLSRAKASEVAEADVVICSYRLLYSQIYCQRRHELSTGPCSSGTSLSDLSSQTKLLIEGSASMRSGRKSELYVSDWQALEFPVLEMFYWRRVVFDEFHELESFESVQQNSLQFLRSHFRWGLTGTPPVESNAGGIFMSSLFRIDLPGYLPRVDGKGLDLQPWEEDRLLTETVGHFLDSFARQNTADLPHIKLQEQVVVVQHTAAERALYLGQAHDAPEFGSAGAFENEEKVKALERLLKLCSHFQAGGGDNAGNAQEECERISDQKERRVVRARNQLRRCCRVIVLLEEKLVLALKTSKKHKKSKTWRDQLDEAKKKAAAESDAGKLASKELDEEFDRATAEDFEFRLQMLDGHRPKSEELLSLLGPDDQQRGCTQQWAAVATDESWTVVNLEKFLRAQADEQAQNLTELQEASASMDFFRRTVQALAKDGGPPEERSCSVCMEEDLPLAKLAITPCAHTFCLECLKVTVEKFSACSICRRQLSSKDVRPIVAEMESPAIVAGSSSSASSSSEKVEEEKTGMRFDKYGTKLEVLVRKLRQLRVEDTAAKVILFVQFDDLKRKVSSALNEFGIPCASLQGAVGQRASIIRDWQHNPQSQTFVLLLSLAQSASGSNLTAASHVVFLHPMLASSAEKAVGYEMQAIGRARRHGQPRSVVHVWRFVTTGTLEQAITEQHQGALWKSEQERQEERRKLQSQLQQREQNAQQEEPDQVRGAE